MIHIKEASVMINSHARSWGTEVCGLEEAFNRVLAENILADRDYPPFNRAAMDGYALQSSDINRDHLSELEVIGNLHAGQEFTEEILSGQCIKIMTGAPAPLSVDAVIRLEDTEERKGRVSIKKPDLKTFENIAKKGEDILNGQCLVSSNQWINSAIMGVLAVTGKSQVRVMKCPCVSIISTGSELVHYSAPVLPYQIRDSNGPTLKAFFSDYLIKDIHSQMITDDRNALKQAISTELNRDIVVLTGGVSKGEADYIPQVLQELGIQQLFHRVRIKPGNPIWLGCAPSGALVFALPGNPYSVQVAFKIFIEPFLRKSFGLGCKYPLYFPLMTIKNKKTPFDEFFPCQLVAEGDFSRLLPRRFNGSGDIAATLYSEGIGWHPADQATLSSGTRVAFYPWNREQ
ncbi:MAG: molybdopterin molybdotransferase MoeA [Chitinophagaceae bacterium]